MDDQQNAQKPKLTPEEELDVLEAVWKIGKEKGLDLLRPEQIKKLTDAGRITDAASVPQQTSAGVKKQLNSDTIGLHADLVVSGLMVDAESEGSKLYSPEVWEKMGSVAKKKVSFAMFVSMYGFSPESLRSEIFKRMMKDRMKERPHG